MTESGFNNSPRIQTEMSLLVACTESSGKSSMDKAIADAFQVLEAELRDPRVVYVLGGR